MTPEPVCITLVYMPDDNALRTLDAFRTIKAYVDSGYTDMDDVVVKIAKKRLRGETVARTLADEVSAGFYKDYSL